MKKRIATWTAALCVLGAPVLAGDDPFGDFISPVSSPVVAEDARPISELRPIYYYQRIAEDFGESLGIDGGDLHAAVVQGRLALSERFAIIVNKIGVVWLRPDDEVFGTLETDDGWLNLGFGMKYAFYRDPERRAMATFGLRYETSTGDKDVFSGRGDGLLNPFFAGLWGIGDLHLQGYTGPRIPISGNDSTRYDMSLHGDYKLGAFHPLIEFNWMHTLDGGRRLPLRDEGFDLFTIGSRGAGGRGVVTLAAGGRLRLLEALDLTEGQLAGVDLGCAYEVPITNREEFLGWRIVSDLTFRFQ